MNTRERDGGKERRRGGWGGEGDKEREEVRVGREEVGEEEIRRGRK